MSISKRLIDPNLSEEPEFVPVPPVAWEGMSLDETIHEFIKVSARANELYSRKKELVGMLASHAARQRGTQKTVHLSASDGARLKVEFKTTRTYDPQQMFTAADVLGKDVFDGLFVTTVEFKAQLRNLNTFLNTVYTDEKMETGKQIIREATLETDGTPYISTEKTT